MGKKIQCIGRYVMDGQSLGKGNFARVELATHGVTGCKVAIKIIDTRKIKEDYTRNNLHREARILGQIRHPHIIRLYETLKATTLYCLVLEYAAGGDLLTYIKTQNHGCLVEVKARIYFRQLVSAMHFLHERGVAHRDLKMENILLDEKHKNLKVIDFGLSNTFSRKELMKTHCGSLEYAAPELIASNDKYGPEVDIWSLGIILYGMVIGKLPFSTHYTDQYRRQKLLVQIEKGLTETHTKELTLHATSQELQELLNKLIEPSVERRLTLIDCEINAWVTNCNKLPFCPFQSLPKDKPSKSQVIDELAAMLETPRPQVEEQVHESKCDDYSAMFNMMLDTKRAEKGLFDLDFTQRQEVKKEKHRRKHHHKSGTKKEHKSKAIYNKGAKSNHIAREQFSDRPDPPSKISHFNVWEELVKATPAILCPELDVPSDHEADVKTSHNSTSFDLMAICSKPTWLGSDRRKTKRRRSPMPPPSPMPNADGDKAGDEPTGAAAAAHDAHHALLSPTQASTQVAQLLRRNSSRRRTRRNASTGGDPPSRSESLRRIHRRRPSTPTSGQHSPNSPNTLNLNNPEIKIDTPKQSPVSAVRRPAHLKGLRECYGSDSSKGLTRTMTLGPNTSYQRRRTQRRRPLGSDTTDGGDSVHSDSSNPCSTSNLHEVFSDGSQDILSQSESQHGSRTSFGSLKDNIEPTVESRIAATDIRSIVRPKQIILRGKVSGQKLPQSNLLVPCHEDAPCRSMSASPEIIIETMQPNTFANLSDDEKIERQMSCEIPKTDSEKRVQREKSDMLTTVNSDTTEMIKSSTELLGAASIKPMEPHEGGIFNGASLCDDLNGASGGEHYASDDQSDANVSKMVQIVNRGDSFRNLHEPKHLVADLYSKREKISLEDNKILMQDDICFGDSSDHNSSQENLLMKKTPRRRRLKESLTSDEVESVSAPILLSPRELGLTLTPTETPGESTSGRKSGSVMSSRHGSTPSVRFIMPSTPIRQMFQTPIARVESFHSDDFEVYTSDIDALVTSPTPSPSPKSIQTPTVPCFQYKLHSRRKKSLLGKKSKIKQLKDGLHQRDGILTYHQDRNAGNDTRCIEALVSSGSECGSDGQVPDGEKGSNASKAKIFPMENSDDQIDGKQKLNDRTKVISDIPANQNSSKKQQNSICKSFIWKPAPETETAKKSSWRRGFVHLLKKKRFSNLGHSTGNNNNNVDSPSRNRMNNHSSANSSNTNTNINAGITTTTTSNNTRNGHARGAIRAIPPSTLDIQATNVEIKWSPAKVVHNNVKTAVETGTTSDIGQTRTPSPSPSKPKVFDFTIVSSETAKNKHCLLSWKACRECTFSDDPSSSEGSDANDCNNQVQGKVDDNAIPMTSLRSSSVSAGGTMQS